MKDIAKKTESDLLKELSAKREALQQFRFAIAGSKIKNVKEGRSLRKDIARILTELNTRRRISNIPPHRRVAGEATKS